MNNCIMRVKTKKRKDDYFNILTAFGSQFGLKGEKNPLVYHFNDTWQVRFSDIVNCAHSNCSCGPVMGAICA